MSTNLLERPVAAVPQAGGGGHEPTVFPPTNLPTPGDTGLYVMADLFNLVGPTDGERPFLTYGLVEPVSGLDGGDIKLETTVEITQAQIVFFNALASCEHVHLNWYGNVSSYERFFEGMGIAPLAKIPSHTVGQDEHPGVRITSLLKKLPPHSRCLWLTNGLTEWEEKTLKAMREQSRELREAFVTDTNEAMRPWVLESVSPESMSTEDISLTLAYVNQLIPGEITWPPLQ